MPTEPTPGSRLRKLLTEGTVVLPGVFNAATALQAREAGFGALYLSGAGVTNSLLGVPDIALLTLSEMAQQARYVTRASGLPVIADADTGYGEALNVRRTVEEFETAGLAGLHIEDQVAPKRCGHLDGKQLIDATEMARKVRAAVKARASDEFFIIARTDARGVTTMDDAVERAKRCLDAGADAIFPESLRSEGEFEEFAERVDAVLLANMTEFGKTPLIPVPRFTAMGYRLVIFPMTAFRTMMFAARSTYAELLRSGTQAGLIDRMQTRQELYELLDYQAYDRFDSAVAEEVKP